MKRVQSVKSTCIRSHPARVEQHQMLTDCFTLRSLQQFVCIASEASG